MVFIKRAVIDNVRTLAFGAMSSNYAAVGATTTDPIRMVYAFNNTDVYVWLSDDGVNDKFFLAPGAFLLLDITSNMIRDQEFLLPIGIWYARDNQVAATSGALYLTLIH